MSNTPVETHGVRLRVPNGKAYIYPIRSTSFYWTCTAETPPFIGPASRKHTLLDGICTAGTHLLYWTYAAETHAVRLYRCVGRVYDATGKGPTCGRVIDTIRVEYRTYLLPIGLDFHGYNSEYIGIDENYG